MSRVDSSVVHDGHDVRVSESASSKRLVAAAAPIGGGGGYMAHVSRKMLATLLVIKAIICEAALAR